MRPQNQNIYADSLNDDLNYSKTALNPKVNMNDTVADATD